MNVIYADDAADHEQLEKIKNTPAFKAVKAKVMAQLEGKIDQLVLDQLQLTRKSNSDPLFDYLSLHRFVYYEIKCFLLLCLVTMNMIYSDDSEEISDISAKELKEFEKIKKTPEFQKAKEKVLNTLADRIDKYVLEQFRNK
ncbi:hypothetical protein MN116_004886 [Schistosoma mekongi]|uniref:Uncharacterized protein n=1 Tax=Schistosoma mekongi TaxID=38744 RepID=A0AAE2D500_SCHME|nr:hypothetical protein MN116_004886 [Schistosoma mekongi]